MTSGHIKMAFSLLLESVQSLLKALRISEGFEHRDDTT